MRTAIFPTIFLIFSLHSTCFAQEDYKKTIEALQSRIGSASEEQKGTLEAQLAVAFFKDQEQEKAFRLYLELLKVKPHLPLYEPSTEDERLYTAALAVYLSHNNPKENAETLKKDYEQQLNDHPDYLLLGFLLSAAYANLGEFDKFFPTFYLSYQRNPDHYLAYKTKAALHIKLMERARTGEERAKQQEAIVENAKAASERNPEDTALYKLILTFTKEENRAAGVDLYLHKIIDNNIVISRSDIAFYVQQAVAADRVDLAQQFINKAREWYAFSKVIDAAQQYLDQNKKRADSAVRG